MYIIFMKILIAPFITNPKFDANTFLTENLIVLLQTSGHQCAVSASKENGFKQVSLYDCVQKRRKPIFHFGADNRSHEEWLYSAGALQKDYILEDVALLNDAILDFKPEAVLSLDRPAALTAASMHNIPCYVFTHPAMFRNAYFPSKCMRGMNEALRSLRLEQELDLKSLYSKADQRIGFGTMHTAPYREEYNITRIGSMGFYGKEEVRTNRVCIYLHDTNKNTSSLKKMIEDAFLGAPYYVYVSLPNISSQTVHNIHYLKYPKASLINGASACIHDGNDYFYNQAAANGVPQLILCDHSYMRSYNGMAAARYHFGSYIYEEDLTMASLYEAYRALLSDDDYYESAQSVKNELKELGSLEELLKYL